MVAVHARNASQPYSSGEFQLPRDTQRLRRYGSLRGWMLSDSGRVQILRKYLPGAWWDICRGKLVRKVCIESARVFKRAQPVTSGPDAVLRRRETVSILISRLRVVGW